MLVFFSTVVFKRVFRMYCQMYCSTLDSRLTRNIYIDKCDIEYKTQACKNLMYIFRVSTYVTAILGFSDLQKILSSYYFALKINTFEVRCL